MASNRIHWIFLFVISKEDSIFYATNYWNHIVQSKTFWVFTHLDIFSLQLHANGFKFSFWNLDFTFTKIGYLNLMCVFFNNCLHSGKLYLLVYFSVQSVTVSVNFLVLYICLVCMCLHICICFDLLSPYMYLLSYIYVFVQHSLSGFWSITSLLIYCQLYIWYTCICLHICICQ